MGTVTDTVYQQPNEHHLAGDGVANLPAEFSSDSHPSGAGNCLQCRAICLCPLVPPYVVLGYIEVMQSFNWQQRSAR